MLLIGICEIILLDSPIEHCISLTFIYVVTQRAKILKALPGFNFINMRKINAGCGITPALIFHFIIFCYFVHFAIAFNLRIVMIFFLAKPGKYFPQDGIFFFIDGM